MKNFIIGIYSDGGCHVSAHRNVEINNTLKKYIYTVTTKDCGRCKTLSFSYNLVVVPKLPNN